MTEKNCTRTLGADRDMTEAELHAVVGGGTKASSPAQTPPKSTGLFEITDYSFDVEQVLSH